MRTLKRSSSSSPPNTNSTEQLLALSHTNASDRPALSRMLTTQHLGDVFVYDDSVDEFLYYDEGKVVGDNDVEETFAHEHCNEARSQRQEQVAEMRMDIADTRDLEANPPEGKDTTKSKKDPDLVSAYSNIPRRLRGFVNSFAGHLGWS